MIKRRNDKRKINCFNHTDAQARYNEKKLEFQSSKLYILSLSLICVHKGLCNLCITKARN